MWFCSRWRSPCRLFWCLHLSQHLKMWTFFPAQTPQESANTNICQMMKKRRQEPVLVHRLSSGWPLPSSFSTSSSWSWSFREMPVQLLYTMEDGSWKSFWCLVSSFVAFGSQSLSSNFGPISAGTSVSSSSSSRSCTSWSEPTPSTIIWLILLPMTRTAGTWQCLSTPYSWQQAVLCLY